MIKVTTNIKVVIGSLSAKLTTLRKGGEGQDRVLRVVASSLIGVVGERIHEKGLAADDTLIGQYSTKPIYVSLSANVGSNKLFGKPVGKTGKSQFESGEKKGQLHKSKYFERGYSQFKTEIGRNRLGSVNLSLSGQLNQQLTIKPTSDGYGYGWPDSEKIKIARGHEKKYGKNIWALTEAEKELMIKVAEKELKNAIS